MSNFNNIIKSETPVLVDFYADWCAPCRAVPPVLRQLKDDLGDKVKIIQVNIDKNPVVANKYGIHSIPALFLFKSGDVRWKGLGVRPAAELKKVIEKNLVN